MEIYSKDFTLDFALKCIETLRSAYGNKHDVTKKFRSRCRNLIESIYYSGLTYTLAYIASKGGNVVLENALQANSPKDIVEYIKSQYSQSEEASYALYGSFLIALLRQLEAPEIVNAKSFLEILRNLNTSTTLPVTEEKALRFAEWLKRLAEALFEAE
ncbi:MAG: type III-B CRISPR module-associated protein Cmr5 [archaeon YNP-LCB-003-016]|uniref:type III-B CRISPR module-associated protein Cmr5 n=1 Tax=Candidatus Culexarchaeum yellowstonense TaxID=2928963 RepID=UPI0026ECC761|nr:type III-B CRISPR module-associated protein Cmr5 [Candidatus Culexarchaeum yellowstonense]MCR6692234.1 type III-B CRISPR module-associated protein Cmr5 [Candidatus Culexarchaeum yellowstonense]